MKIPIIGNNQLSLSQRVKMKELPHTKHNIEIIQEFLQETKSRIANGVEMTFTSKGNL